VWDSVCSADCVVYGRFGFSRIDNYSMDVVAYQKGGRPLSGPDGPILSDDSVLFTEKVSDRLRRAAQRSPSVLGFRWHRNVYGNLSVVTAPHWFLMSIFGTLAVLLWLAQLHRFSLRTLLIATTLIAVVLGLVVWSMR
jgi:hypothetical protein